MHYTCVVIIIVLWNIDSEYVSNLWYVWMCAFRHIHSTKVALYSDFMSMNKKNQYSECAPHIGMWSTVQPLSKGHLGPEHSVLNCP